MAEKKGVGHAYNVDFLNVVFAASSLFLFLSVIWMVWDDYDREWKNTQRRFAELEIAGDAGAASSRPARGVDQQQADSSCRRSWPRREQNVAANQAEGRRAAGRSWPRSTRGCTARRRTTSSPRRPTTRTATTSRRRAPAGRPSAERKGEAVAELRTRVERARTSSVEKTTAERQRAAAASSSSSPARSATIQKQIDELHAGADAAAARRLDVLAPSLVEGLLPQRAAARLHGADDQGPADHPAERRRRRELHARAEDGSVHDLPPGDRPRRATRSIRSRSRRTRT